MHQITPAGENRLLGSLSLDDRAKLSPDLAQVPLKAGTVLHPAGRSINHIYFPISGMVSLLAVTRSGQQVETGVIGREGVVGAWIGVEGARSFGQATVQIGGSGWRLGTEPFLAAYAASPAFRSLMNRYQSFVSLQVVQSAACHAFHGVEARLCRWLLQARDVAQQDTLDLTQDFLSHMLGVRRTSVSRFAHKLQKARLIRYSRGRITILNRNGIEKGACECYRVVRRELSRAASAAR
jgi:CRP-like cAMP-binding protein